MTRLFLTLLFTLVCSLAVTAQRYQFKNYKVEEGLINNETYAILQDSHRQIWISTMGGVSRFDGKNFKNYTTEDGLASNICFSLFEDSKGRIWVGTLDNGISIIENGKITNPKGVDFDFLGSATTITEGQDGTIYILFVHGILTYKNGKLEYLIKDSPEQKVSGIQGIAWYDSNTAYIPSIHSGIYKLTLNPLKFENIYNENNGVNNICYSVKVDAKKNVWVGAYGELYKITNGNLTTYRFAAEDFDKNRIYGIYEENEHELFLSTEGNGFGIFDKNSGHLKIFNQEQGLPSKYIYKMVKDTEGNYWMTSYGEGIIRFRDTSFKIFDNKQLPSKTVNDLAEWQNQWVVATDGGMVAIEDGTKINPIVKNRRVNNLFVTPENNLLYTTDEAAMELTANGAQKILDQGVYTLLFKDKSGTYMFGTDKVKVLAKDSTYFIDTKRSIALQPIADRYIICKIGGLYQLKENKVDTIPGLHPKIHYDFRSIDAINQKEVIAGSAKKLYHISIKNNKFKVQTFDLSRFGKMKHFRALKIDGNNLWLAGRDILCKVDLDVLLKKDEVAIEYFPTTAHFMENDVDFNSLLITKNKTVLATSLSGMLAFNGKEFLPNTLPPALNLSEILLFSEPLNDSLYRTKKGIELPYQKNYLTFKMEAITFTEPDNVKYKYRLKGLRNGNSWSAATKDPQVVFSYLPPGKYTFEFTADNGNGVWQEKPYRYNIIIQVPFWKTWFFWFSLLLLAAGGGIFFIHIKNKKAQKRREVFTQGLIKAQEEERTRVARELHDSVGQKLMLLTKKTKETGNVEMESLAGNTLEELRSISRGLHPSSVEKLGITTAIKNLVNEVDANTSIFFTHEIENIDGMISRDASLHLYRIIQEVLNNMVKHAEAKSAMVIIEKKKSLIEAKIEDNGRGFEYSESFSGGLGMNTLMERAKILNSKIDIKSQINKGTTIILSIPY